VDAVIDLVGGEVQARSFAVLSKRLTRIAAMTEAGALATAVGAVLPLAAARVAHEMLEGTRQQLRGKIVLRMGE
jgi:NADPH:quinone reductase-like Zn-dependent oxidoreductase